LQTGLGYIGKREGFTDNIINYPATNAVIQVNSEDEHITDDTQRAPYRVGSCDHYTRKVVHLPGLNYYEGHTYEVSPPVKHIYSGNDAYWKVIFNARDSCSRISVHQVVPTFPRSDRDLLFDVINQFYSFNEVDLLLNVAEADQTVRLINQIKENGNLEASKRFFSSSRKRKAQILASGHLAYSFGIAPLVNDMMNLHSSLRQLDEKFKKYRDIIGKPQRFSANTSGSLSLTTGDKNVLKTDWMSHNLKAIKAERRVVLSGIHRSPYSSPFAQKLGYMWGKYGSPGPASFIWERIPFSFVVDWFVDTGVVLGNLDNLATGCYKEIQRLSGSNSIEYSIVCTTSRNTSSWIDVVPVIGTVVGYQHVRRYTRQPLLQPYGLNWSGRFGKKQMGLATSLLTQIIMSAKR
jgi:hypothetical protein